MWCETQTQYGQFSFLPMFGVIIRTCGEWQYCVAFGWGFWRVSFGIVRRKWKID